MLGWPFRSGGRQLDRADAGVAASGTPGNELNAQGDPSEERSTIVRLLLASSLMLFLELALIRWLGANVVHLSYFSNFVLLGSFLGIGIGFLISRKTWSLWPSTLPLLTLLVIGVFSYPVTIERSGSDVIYFTSLQVNGPPAWLALPIVFLLVARGSSLYP